LECAHVYDKPGNFTVTLRVTNEAGKTASGSATVYVAPANRNQIYVSAWSGNDANPGTWDRPIRTFDRARNMVSDNVEILFKRGETFTMGTPMYLIGRKNVLVGAWGSGEKPVLKYDGSLWLGSTVFTTGPGSDGITFQDITIDSRYTDPNTYEGCRRRSRSAGRPTRSATCSS
jgi:PKD repeat protein